MWGTAHLVHLVVPLSRMFDLTTSDFQSLLESGVARASDAARACLGESRLRQHLGETLRHDLRWCDDMEFARGFAAHCPVEGTRPEDYLHRLIHMSGHTLLAGIRFRGGDRTHPFVDLLASTCTDDDSAFALHALLEEFEAFSPLSVRVMAGERFSPRASRERWLIEVDQLIMAGHVRDIARGEVASEVSCEEVGELEEAVDFLNRSYEETFRLTPELAGVVTPATAEDLEECVSSGLLMWIMRGGERCGLIATYAHRGPICAGPCVMEEIIAPSCRGARLAAQAQRLLAQQIAATEDDALLWGTIDASNLASLHTAQRAGRHAIAAWHWCRVRAS